MFQITHWAFLAVLPWAVQVTTFPWTCDKDNCISVGESVEATYKGHTFFMCDGKEPCQDFVDAMNQAHERRTKRTKLPNNCMECNGKIDCLDPSTAPNDKAVVYRECSDDPGSGLRRENDWPDTTGSKDTGIIRHK